MQDESGDVRLGTWCRGLGWIRPRVELRPPTCKPGMRLDALSSYHDSRYKLRRRPGGNRLAALLSSKLIQGPQETRQSSGLSLTRVWKPDEVVRPIAIRSSWKYKCGRTRGQGCYYLKIKFEIMGSAVFTFWCPVVSVSNNAKRTVSTQKQMWYSTCVGEHYFGE